MGRAKVERTPEEWKKYHADRQRKYYDKHKDKKNARRRELYAEQAGKGKCDE